MHAFVVSLDLSNLSLKVEYIWRMQLSWGKMMFFINRYVPFTLLPVILHGESSGNVYIRVDQISYGRVDQASSPRRTRV